MRLLSILPCPGGRAGDWKGSHGGPREEVGQFLEGGGSRGKGCLVSLWRLWHAPAFDFPSIRLQLSSGDSTCIFLKIDPPCDLDRVSSLLGRSGSGQL